MIEQVIEYIQKRKDLLYQEGCDKTKNYEDQMRSISSAIELNDVLIFIYKNQYKDREVQCEQFHNKNT